MDLPTSQLKWPGDFVTVCKRGNPWIYWLQVSMTRSGYLVDLGNEDNPSFDDDEFNALILSETTPDEDNWHAVHFKTREAVDEYLVNLIRRCEAH